jgi:hypothetical protein
MNIFTEFDKLWPEPWQHFVLGLECGAAIGLIFAVFMFLMGKIKFD